MSITRRKSALRWKYTLSKKHAAAAKSGSSDISFDEVDADFIWPGMYVGLTAKEED